MELENIICEVRKASYALRKLRQREINQLLDTLADKLTEQTGTLLEKGRKSRSNGLTEDCLREVVENVRSLASQAFLTGEVQAKKKLPGGMLIKRIGEPFGVVAACCEDFPHLLPSIFAVCLKGGNACLLQSSKKTESVAKAFMRIIQEALEDARINPYTALLLPAGKDIARTVANNREWAETILLPTGQSLFKEAEAPPMLPLFNERKGICHAYFETYGDLNKGKSFLAYAKSSQTVPLDCLIVDMQRLQDLPDLCAPLRENQVSIYADFPAYTYLSTFGFPATLLHEATENDFRQEHPGAEVAIKTTPSLPAAINHIQQIPSGACEYMFTENKPKADRFCREIGSPCIYINAPLNSDDERLFVQERDIAPGTFHPRFRRGTTLNDVTTSKWVVERYGSIRENTKNKE